VRPDTLAGELVLCLQLLEDVLSYHATAREEGEMSIPGYEELRSAIDKFQSVEIKRLEAKDGDAHLDIRAKAAKNVQDRLRKLAETGSLEERRREPPPPNKRALLPEELVARGSDLPKRRDFDVSTISAPHPVVVSSVPSPIPKDDRKSPAVSIRIDFLISLSIDISSILHPHPQENLKSPSH
jgi:hypothetical protein